VKRPVLIIALLLASCDEPTPGEEAMAELEVSMRSQSDMVRRGVGLQEIFDGRCTDDCSGHRAGYLWALDRPAVRPEDCVAAAKGESFADGCRM
jgi:hypothetical protein